jgi:hypothetical protein
VDYDQFLEALKSNDWSVPNRSFAYKTFDGVWQISFIRMGGRFQKPGTVTFVICVRSTNLRNLDGEHQEVEKEPHSYPFKLTLAEIDKRRLKYQSKLNNYEMTDLAMTGDWSAVLRALEEVLPEMLGSYSQAALAKDIAKRGEDGYIEKIWLEDLSASG